MKTIKGNLKDVEPLKTADAAREYLILFCPFFYTEQDLYIVELGVTC